MARLNEYPVFVETGADRVRVPLLFGGNVECPVKARTGYHAKKLAREALAAAGMESKGLRCAMDGDRFIVTVAKAGAR